jgi:small subunit ribosomal protein S4
VEAAMSRGIPAWLTLDKDSLVGRVMALPQRQDISMEINEQLIVELYSK